MSGRATDPFDALKRRVSLFLGDRRDHRSSVREFVGELAQHGEAAIVGGMLRDLLVEKYGKFTSDVDFVVDAPDVPALERFLVGRGGVRNKFGGYALPLRWKVDVWPLQRTWAHVQGHREVRVLEDVLRTTFFNWDAILYVVGQRRVVARHSYLDEVNRLYLDLNLSANPNPRGSLIRTMRAAARHYATLSPALTEYAHRLLADTPGHHVLAGEVAAYGSRAVLTTPGMDRATATIAAAAAAGAWCVPFPHPRPQLPLPVGKGGILGTRARRPLRERLG